MNVAADALTDPAQVEPGLAAARGLAVSHNLIPLRHSFIEHPLGVGQRAAPAAQEHE